MPILEARLFDREMVGIPLLGEMGEEVYGDRDVDRDPVPRRPDPGAQAGLGGYVLSMRLPFVSRDDMDIHRRGDELFVRVGSYKRNLILPQTLKRMVVREANFAGDHLEIFFARGRGADDHGMTGSGAQAIGLDVGGTKTAAIRVTIEGTVLARQTLPTPANDMQATLDTMVEVARAVIAPEVRAIGVGAAGLVEKDTGRLTFAPNLAWRNTPLAQHMWDAIGLPTLADNDANAAAWGEYRLGAARASATCCSSEPGRASGAASSSTASCSGAPTGSRARSGTSSSILTGRCAGVGTMAAGSSSRAATRSRERGGRPRGSTRSR